MPSGTVPPAGRREKRKGVAQRVPGVAWMEVFQKGPARSFNLRCWNPTHSVAFQKLRQSPGHPQDRSARPVLSP